MQSKTIIFDLDGTIADTLPLCIAAFKRSIEPLLGREVGEAEIIATLPRRFCANDAARALNAARMLLSDMTRPTFMPAHHPC